MYAYIDSFRKFGKTNTDNQSIKIKRPYPQRAGSFFCGEGGANYVDSLLRRFGPGCGPPSAASGRLPPFADPFAPGRHPGLASVGIALVDGQPDETPLAAETRGGGVASVGVAGSDEGAAGRQQRLVDQSEGVAEGVGVGGTVAAAEERHALALKVLPLQRLEKSVPVVLQLAASPRRGAEQQQIVAFRLVGRGVGDVVEVGVGNAQRPGDVPGHELGRSGRAPVENSGHDFFGVGSLQRKGFASGGAIPAFRGFARGPIPIFGDRPPLGADRNEKRAAQECGLTPPCAARCGL